MTQFNYQNHNSKFSKQNSAAIFANFKIERAAQIAELDKQPSDDDVWLQRLIKALKDSGRDHDS